MGLVVSEEAWAETMDLHGLTLHEVPLTRLTDAELNGWPAGTVAVLGLAAVLRMDIIFDGKNHVTYAHPIVTKAAHYAHNRMGAVFVPETLQSDDLIAHVAAGSPAAMAGIKDGDILLKVDQLDVTPWRTRPGILPLSRFGEMAAGTKLHLVLRRGNKVITAVVELRTILGN